MNIAQLVSETYDEGDPASLITSTIGSATNGPTKTVERLAGPDPLTDVAGSRMS